MKKVSILLFLVLFICQTAQVAFAKASDELIPLLVDLKGFYADAADGETMDMVPGMKVINATRSYTNDTGSVDATILVGTNAMVQSQAVNQETEDAKVETIKVQGFSVIHSYDKVNASGNFVVGLKQGANEGAMFMIYYQDISKEDALAVLDKYDLKKMETAVSKMMS